MTLLTGFLGNMIIPAGVISLCGFLFFWIRLVTVEKVLRSKYFLLLFVGVVFIFCLLWRVGITVERYARVLIIPGTVFFLYFFHEFLSFSKQFKSSWLPVRQCVFLITLGCFLAVGIGFPLKALRVKEKKPHLQEIPAMLEKIVKDESSNILLLILGNTGGILKSKHFDMYRIDLSAAKRYDFEAALAKFSREMPVWTMRGMYDRIFVLCVEKTTPVFCAEWRKYMGTDLVLRYEFINKRNSRAYRLYELSLPGRSFWQNREEMLTFFKKHNIAENGDFSAVTGISKETPFVQNMMKRGYDVLSAGEAKFPQGWIFDTKAGFRETRFKFFDYSFTPGAENEPGLIRINADGMITLWNNGRGIPAGEYVAFVDLAYCFARSYAVYFPHFVAATNVYRLSPDFFQFYTDSFQSMTRIYHFTVPAGMVSRPAFYLMQGGSVGIRGFYVVPLDILKKEMKVAI